MIYRFAEYDAEVADLAIEGPINEIGFSTLAMCGEVGEFANEVKKFLRGDDNTIAKTEARKIKLRDELGDILWYVANTARILGVPLEEVAQANVEKLKQRYGV